MLCEMEFEGAIRINEVTANLLMIPLTVIRARIEASPDCHEKNENLAALASIMGHLPVKEGKTDEIVYWRNLK